MEHFWIFYSKHEIDFSKISNLNQILQNFEKIAMWERERERESWPWPVRASEKTRSKSWQISRFLWRTILDFRSRIEMEGRPSISTESKSGELLNLKRTAMDESNRWVVWTRIMNFSAYNESVREICSLFFMVSWGSGFIQNLNTVSLYKFTILFHFLWP